MEISINEKLIEDRKLLDEDILLLLTLKKESNIRKILKKLEAKGLIEDIIPYNNISLTKKGNETLEYLQVHGNSKVINKDQDITKLVMQMKELYPKGKKPGTNYMWRCSTPELVKRIKVLIAKYDFNYSNEQILNATEKYVKSFNGNYTMMRLLKYFILKIEKDIDGNAIVTSDLMSLLENEDSENINNDWTTRLI